MLSYSRHTVILFVHKSILNHMEMILDAIKESCSKKNIRLLYIDTRNDYIIIDIGVDNSVAPLAVKAYITGMSGIIIKNKLKTSSKVWTGDYLDIDIEYILRHLR